MINPRLLARFGMLVFFKLNFYEVSGQIFSLTSSFLSNSLPQVVRNGKSSHEQSVNMLEFLKALF